MVFFWRELGELVVDVAEINENPTKLEAKKVNRHGSRLHPPLLHESEFS